LINFNQAFQLLTLVLTVASGVVTQIFGFKAINKAFDDKLSKFAEVVWAAMHNKLDVSVYAAKTRELHDKNNELATKCAALEAEVNMLKTIINKR
jgi:hypothetical protein